MLTRETLPCRAIFRLFSNQKPQHQQVRTHQTGLRTAVTPNASPWRPRHGEAGRGRPWGRSRGNWPVPGASGQQSCIHNVAGLQRNPSEPGTCVPAQCKAPVQAGLQNGPKQFCSGLHTPESKLTPIPMTQLPLRPLGQQRVEDMTCGLSRPRYEEDLAPGALSLLRSALWLERTAVGRGPGERERRAGEPPCHWATVQPPPQRVTGTHGRAARRASTGPQNAGPPHKLLFEALCLIWGAALDPPPPNGTLPYLFSITVQWALLHPVYRP